VATCVGERELKSYAMRWARRTGQRKKRNPQCPHAIEFHECAKYQVVLAKLAVRKAMEMACD
jgi:hypothetical protein